VFERCRDELLDLPQKSGFGRCHQRNRPPVLSGPTGAPHTMHVVLCHQRQIEIDDQRQMCELEAAGGDVRSDQHAHPTRLEVVEGTAASGLTLVAVDDAGADATLSNSPLVPKSDFLARCRVSVDASPVWRQSRQPKREASGGFDSGLRWV
jgi:hypothetical protein